MDKQNSNIIKMETKNKKITKTNQKNKTKNHLKIQNKTKLNYDKQKIIINSQENKPKIYKIKEEKKTKIKQKNIKIKQNNKKIQNRKQDKKQTKLRKTKTKKIQNPIKKKKKKVLTRNRNRNTNIKMINWNKGNAKLFSIKDSIEFILQNHIPDIMTVQEINITIEDDINMCQIPGYKLELDMLLQKFGRG